MEHGETHELLAHWPWLIWVVAAYFVLRFLSLSFEQVEKVLGPLGKFWRTRRIISSTEGDDLRRQVLALNSRVETLFWRDQCYFAYILADQEWHHRMELMAADCGWRFEHHQPFLEFRDRWMTDRGLERELEVWKLGARG